MPNSKQLAANAPHVVVVGGGFAGLVIAKGLRRKKFRVTLIDKNNFHQFSPLLYQVAAAQLEPSAILFPLRKEVKPYPRHRFIMATAQAVDPDKHLLKTNVGDISYDYLILATGADTNYFGMEGVQQHSFALKSVSEALALRNHILALLERAASCTDAEERKRLLCVAIVGGGPTGVEVAGAIGEMKRYVLPRDYPDINPDELRIVLIEGTNKLLSAMSNRSFSRAQRYLGELGVEVQLGNQVTGYDGQTLTLKDNKPISTHTVVWASGISACRINGLEGVPTGRGGRFCVDEYNRLQGHTNIFAVGDLCLQTETDYPNGHPQVAPVAIQQSQLLVRNLRRLQKEQPLKPFRYTDKGSMAIVGHSRAVAEVAHLKMGGFMAWLIWLFVHLLSIIGFKNKLVVVIDWAFSYFSHDSSLRLIIRPKHRD